MTYPSSVIVRDTSLRDGLQSIARVVPTDVKLQWLHGLYEAGLREIEVGSFVPPRLMPQLADTAQLVAAESGAHAMLLPMSASHAHSLANLRKTPDEVVVEVARIRSALDAAGSACTLEVGLSTAFGCTIQGDVPEAEVLRLAQAALDAGADCISLADTVGYADPRQVKDIFTKVFAFAGDKLVCGHFHDTRGLGLANVMASLEAGVSRFDACVAGLGGCPHAPGASGNVSAEDLVYLMHSMKIQTGIDFARLLALRERVTQWLAGECFQGTIWKVGLPKTMQAA